MSDVDVAPFVGVGVDGVADLKIPDSDKLELLPEWEPRFRISAT